MRPLVGPALFLLALAFPGAASSVGPTTTDLGRCVGRGGPGSEPILEGPAYDLRAHPLSAAEIKNWLAAGYSTDAEHLLFPDGRPVPEAERARLLEPFDAAVDCLDSNDWTNLQTGGYRLDETTCRLLAPRTRRPITRLEIKAIQAQGLQRTRFAALERLAARLRQADPLKPPPKELLDEMRMLESAGVRLPDSLRQALFLGHSTVGELSGTAEASYAALLRKWDAARGLNDLNNSALPVQAGAAPPGYHPARVLPWEERIGDLLSADLERAFSRTPSGRELLGHFRDKKGVLHLPPLTMRKFSQGPDEEGMGQARLFYDPGSRSVAINHWVLADQLLESVPERRRAALRQRLSDPAALTAYFESHPRERAAVMDRVDYLFYHELTHAWQYRRQTLGLEMLRGNVPSADPIAHELEAYFAEYRYLHDKLLRDPSLALRNGDYFPYLSVLHDPEAYRDGITRYYLRTFSGVSDYKTLEQIQAERRRELLGPGRSKMRGWLARELEKAGLDNGTTALRVAERDSDARLAPYFHDYIPRMRQEAVDRLAPGLAVLGRPDLALQVLEFVPSSKPVPAKVWEKYIHATERLFLNPRSNLGFDERNGAFHLLDMGYRRMGERCPPAITRAYDADVHAHIGELVARFEKEGAPNVRRELLRSISAWAASLPADDPFRERTQSFVKALQGKNP